MLRMRNINNIVPDKYSICQPGGSSPTGYLVLLLCPVFSDTCKKLVFTLGMWLIGTNII